jgi:DTW domain-containing protein YfiP
MSHQRIKRSPRCAGCGLPPLTCLCASLPRIRIDTPLVLLQHVRERPKPTNTGRLFARMVENVVVLPWGMRGAAFDPGPLRDASIDWLLLYPRVGAPVLDAGWKEAQGRRRGFVLLDGSWSQCSHVRRRQPELAALPCVALPPGPPPFWTVREQHLEEGRSTFDAALQVVGLFEGPALVAPLRRAFAALTARMLHLKGKLPSPEVPADWVV